MLAKDTIRRLKSITGNRHCQTDLEELVCYSYDATNLSYMPDAVVFPGDTQEIVSILKLANDVQFPVIPRGAGSGITGGSLPVQGGVVVAMSRLNKILSIDTENLVAVVEPGVVTGHLQEAVSAHGLFYPPDPASLAFSTIGGNVAECAGGPRAVKYGVTKDYVTGMEAVLATGELVQTGVQTVKGVVGYDFTKLLVGSEGTLAIITKIVLKLIPQPESRRTLLAVFEDMVQAATAVKKIIHARFMPSALEFMDRNAIRCVEKYQNVKFPGPAGAILLIEVDGDNEAVQRRAEEVCKLCINEQAVEVNVATTEKEAEVFWQARRAIAPALFKLNPKQVSEDIVVPRSRIPDMVARLENIGYSHGLTLVCFGHAGDGNIHVNIMINPDDKDEVARTKIAVIEIFKETLTMGGTLSGEHGVGITKAPYIGMEIDQMGIEAMRRIKHAFDPQGILNPGKIFPDS